MKRKLLLASVSVLAVFLFAQAAFAGWGGGPRAMSSENWVNMADKLNLSDEQAQKIQDLQKDSFTATQDIRAKLQQLMFELRSLRWEPGADKTTVEAKIDEVNNLRQQLYTQRQQYREQMLSQFTDEQLAQMVRSGGCGRGGFGGGFAPNAQ